MSSPASDNKSPFQCKAYFLTIENELAKGGGPANSVYFEVLGVNNESAWIDLPTRSDMELEKNKTLMKKVLAVLSDCWPAANFWVTADGKQIAGITQNKPPGAAVGEPAAAPTVKESSTLTFTCSTTLTGELPSADAEKPPKTEDDGGG